MAWLRALARLSRTSNKFPFSPPSPCFSTAAASFPATPPPSSVAGDIAGLGPTVQGKEKPRVVVLGSGWAGCRLMKSIDTNVYDVVCVSPRNHMVFTPLLASTCVGTLEFRSVAEPIGRIQPAISHAPGSYFFLARCAALDPESHTVSVCLIFFLELLLGKCCRFMKAKDYLGDVWFIGIC